MRKNVCSVLNVSRPFQVYMGQGGGAIGQQNEVFRRKIFEGNSSGI
jgi:hypothetical protein